MKKSTFLLCIILLLCTFTECTHSVKSNILHFKARNIENIEVYHFVVPTDAKGIIVSKNEDIQRIIKSFS